MRTTKTDMLLAGIAVGTATFGILGRKKALSARVGGGAMLATTLVGEPTSRPMMLMASLAYLFIPNIVELRDDESTVDGLGDARHQLYTMPRRWWMPDSSKGEKNCYQSKVEALVRFSAYNSRVIENYNGISHEESPAEFDSLNAKHGLRGNRAIVNIAQALWVAMPPGRPYCLTDMDIEALNETSPGREAIDSLGVGFEIPDFAIADKQNREQMEIWKNEKHDMKNTRPPTRVPSSQEEVPF